jgi:hypothetical protein
VLPFLAVAIVFCTEFVFTEFFIINKFKLFGFIAVTNIQTNI